MGRPIVINACIGANPVDAPTLEGDVSTLLAALGISSLLMVLGMVRYMTALVVVMPRAESRMVSGASTPPASPA